MRHRTLKLGLVVTTALGAALPLLATGSAYADYAPSKGDIVGVGSDTLQYMVDFIADGDAYGDTGYNQLGNKNKLISFDATADANARLAYGVNGGQTGQSSCTPGTGGTAGTANGASYTGGAPCVLNPTLVLRAGLQPVQRPNGSGGGFKALVQDIVGGHNSGTGEVINFSRASSTQSTTATLPGGQNIDQLEVATDTLPMLTSEGATTVAAASNGVNVSTFTGTQTLTVGSTANAHSSGTITVTDSAGPVTLTYTGTTATTFTGVTLSSGTGSLATSNPVAFPNTNAFPLSAGQLSTVYAANTCLTWSDPRISGVIVNGSTTTNGSTTVTEPSSGAPSGPVTSANVGWAISGPGIPNGDTVASVQSATSFTLTTAAGAAAGTGAISLTNPNASTDSIIPIIPQVGSGTRTFFLGSLSPTLSNPGSCAVTAEENDPTAVAQQTNPLDAIEPISQGRLDLFAGVNNTGASGGIGGYFLDPSCAYLSGAAACGSGTVGGSPAWRTNTVNPAVATLTGTPVGSAGTLYDPLRPLYLYFRNSDIASATAFQPGQSENWLNTLFYDPCPTGASNCTGGGLYGAAGPPYIAQGEGQTLLEDAGVTPLSPEVCTDITTSTSC